MKVKVVIPCGERDWQRKIKYLQRLRRRLERLKVTGGLGVRARRLAHGSWAQELMARASGEGLSVYFHPPFDMMFGISKEGKLSNDQKLMADEAGSMKERYGLDWLLVHPDAAQWDNPREPFTQGFGPLNSTLSAEDMVERFFNQIDPLRELNSRCENILAVEPVHTVLYHRTGEKYILFYAGQFGYLDTKRLAEETKSAIFLDWGHLEGTQELVDRSAWYYLRLIEPPRKPMSEKEKLWAEVSGYHILKDYPPISAKALPPIEDLIEEWQPVGFHLTGHSSLLDYEWLVGDHKDFDLRNKYDCQLLDSQVSWVMQHGGILETEVSGWAPGWSERPRDTWGYQKSAITKILGAIERYKETN